MKWIIIGTGQISGEFVENLYFKKEEIVGIVSRSLEKAKLFSKKYRIANAFDLTEEVDVNYDAVYIGTPNSTHYQIAERFLKLQKNVLVEKIMTHSGLKTKRLFKLAEENQVNIMEGYVHITRPWIRSKKEWNVTHINGAMMQKSHHIKDNTYQKASSFNNISYGGVLPDLGCYPISLAIWILGRVKFWKIEKLKFFNDVEAELSLQINHTNGTSDFMISKLEDGPHQLFFDHREVQDELHLKEEFRMQHEIDVFVNHDPFLFKHLSINVSAMIAQMKRKIETCKKANLTSLPWQKFRC